MGFLCHGTSADLEGAIDKLASLEYLESL